MFRHGELWRRVHAFGNEVAQTDDSVIVEATRTSALPHSKQINLGLLWGPRLLPLEGRSGFALGTRFESKQTKCAVWDAMRGSVVQQMVIKFTN